MAAGASSAYDDPAGTWAQSCFAVAQVWLWDELLYDAEREVFTPERLLADARVARAEAEDHTPTADLIDRIDDPRQHRRIAEAGGGDDGAEIDTLGHRRQPRHE